MLYRRFAEPEFAQLRTAFENFVAEHWRGPIAKRHKRLHEVMLERTTWVPANHARRQLQVSGSRLIELVRSGDVIGEERVTEKGRRFLVVHRESLLAMRPALNDELDLSTTSEMLGLTRARLRSALPQLFPEARKIEGDASRWAISRAAVDGLLSICNAPTVGDTETGQVSLEHILRFWCCSNTEIAALLASMRSGTLKPIGCLTPGDGLSRLVFQEKHVHQLIDAARGKRPEKWTIPEVAELLGIKQEVAYFLVRQGLLETTTEVVGRRECSFVNRVALDRFRDHYVFARDLAKLRKTSSRSLQSQLAEIHIRPTVSPQLAACRQVIYEQTQALKELFPEIANH
jgi:hypothetical protein